MNYKHLNTLFSSVNNFLKKWPGRLVTLQHLVLFRDTLIYFSYYRIKNKLTSQRNRTFSEQSRPLLYHAMRTSTCQILIAWLESNQRPVLIHTFTVSFTIIVSTDLPLNYTQSKIKFCFCFLFFAIFLHNIRGILFCKFHIYIYDLYNQIYRVSKILY